MIYQSIIIYYIYDISIYNYVCIYITGGLSTSMFCRSPVDPWQVTAFFRFSSMAHHPQTQHVRLSNAAGNKSSNSVPRFQRTWSPGVPQETNFFRRTFIPEEWWSKPAGISSAIRGCSSNRRQCHVATLVHPWHSRILGSYPKIAWIYGCLSLPSYSHSILVKCLKPTSKDK